jgi:hypothetical protein
MPRRLFPGGDWVVVRKLRVVDGVANHDPKPGHLGLGGVGEATAQEVLTAADRVVNRHYGERIEREVEPELPQPQNGGSACNCRAAHHQQITASRLPRVAGTRFRLPQVPPTRAPGGTITESWHKVEPDFVQYAGRTKTPQRSMK